MQIFKMKMQNILEQIQELSEKLFVETIRLRRKIHQYPELSEREFVTARYIYNTLKSYGIDSHLHLNDTAVIATIEGRENGVMIGLRADIDALPIEEKTNAPYESVNKGIMHACGHDVHAASLLTTANILQQTRDMWSGKVQLFFQPSEEKYPGGAIRMIKAGLMDENIKAMLAMHVSPELDTGKVGMKEGKFMASTDEIYVCIKGIGGHAAVVHSLANPIMITAHALLEVDKQFKAMVPDEFPTVFTFGHIIGAGKTNIIPNEVCLEGTLRTFDENWRKEAHKLIKKTIVKVAAEHGGTANVRIVTGYPVLCNDANITRWSEEAAKCYLGDDNVLEIPSRMTGDDFVYFTQQVPSLMYRLGVKIEGKELNLHAPDFDINETALKHSPGLMAYLAVNLLSKLKTNG